MITGVPASNQVLQLVDGDGPGGNSKAVAMQDDEKVLGFYSPREFQTIVVRIVLIQTVFRPHLAHRIRYKTPTRPRRSPAS